MNWKEWGRNLSQPNFKQYPSILNTEKKNTQKKKLVTNPILKAKLWSHQENRTDRTQARIWNQNIIHTKARVPTTALTTFSIKVLEAANKTFRKHVHSNAVHNFAVTILSYQKSSYSRKPWI
jgi:hypothetical protein